MARRSLIARILVLVALVGGAYALWQSYGEYERSQRIAREVEVLRQEAERVARENQSLSEKIAYFSSPDYQEHEAKEKLGLKRSDEVVVTLQGTAQLAGASPVLDGTEPAIAWSVPYYRKWWERFFGNQ
jgi:cell division protein FtsB